MAQKPKNARSELVENVGKLLLPFLENAGFERRPLSRRERESSDLRSSFPFGTMIRRQGESIHLLNIQLDKHERAQFILNFGAVPPKGVVLPSGVVPIEEALVSDLLSVFRLHPKQHSLRWFRRSWMSFLGFGDAANPVNDAIALFPQVETWFRDGVAGPNVQQIGFPTDPVAASAR